MEISRRSMIGGVAAAATIMSGAAKALGQGSTFDLLTLDGRTCRVWRTPSSGKRRGTILFSHGAASAPWKYAPLVNGWSAAGYEIFAPLHVDSTDHPDMKRYPTLASWPARIEDMRALAAHLGRTSYIAAGHSYGALLALTLGGATPVTPAAVKRPLRDGRVRAVVAFSPPGPLQGFIDKAGYAGLAVPSLIQTGTLDMLPGMARRWQDHLTAFDAAPVDGRRYALVLEGADHYFGGGICRPDLPGPVQRAQLNSAIAVSLLFLGALGRGSGWQALDATLNDAGPVRLSRK